MVDAALVVVVAAVAGLVAVALLALRRPEGATLGLRNARRRPVQAVVVALGLTVATGIVTSSLVAGDSLERGLRQGAYDALGEVDELVDLDGSFPYPGWVAEELARDPRVQRTTDGTVPLLLARGSVALPDRGQTEPQVLVVGYPQGNPVFGEDLPPGDVVLNQRLATALDAGPGDTVVLRAAPPRVPLLPNLTTVNGTVAAGGGGPLPLPGSSAQGTNTSTRVHVGEDARGLVAVLAWRAPGNASDLDLALEAPSGAVHRNATTGTRGPVLLHVPEDAVEAGNWTAHVEAKHAADARFRLVVAVLVPTYDAGRVQAFAREHPELAKRVANGSLGGGDGGRAVELVVDAVARGGDSDLFLTPNLLVPLETLQAQLGLEGRITHVAVSNPGPAVGGERGSEAAVTALEAALADLAREHPGELALPHLEVHDMKRSWVQASEEAGATFTDFLTLLGSFTVLAGLMLVVNLLVMLARERRPELGMARALGLQRRHLVLQFLVEGSVYVVGATVLGVVAGVALAAGLLHVLNDVFQSEVSIAVPLVVEPWSLVHGAALGLLLTLVTVAVASHRLAGLNIVRSIRRLPEPDEPATHRTLLAGAVLTVASAALTSWAFAVEVAWLQVLGPGLVVVGLAMVATRWVRRSLAYPLAGATALALAMASLFLLDAGGTRAILTRAPVQALVLVLASVLLLVHAPFVPRFVQGVLERVPRMGAVARVAGAGFLRKRLRTGLTMAMFALVVLTVVLFSILFTLFQPPVAEQTAGYEVHATTAQPVADLGNVTVSPVDGVPGSDAPLETVESVHRLETGTLYGGDHVRIAGRNASSGPDQTTLIAYGAAFADAARYDLAERHGDYASDAAAYRAVRENPSLVIVSKAWGFDGSVGTRPQPGDVLTLRTVGGTRNLTIVGVQEQVVLGGLWVHGDVVGASFGAPRGELLIDLEPGADASRAARALEAGFQEVGMDAKVFEEEVESQLAQSRRLFSLFRVYMGLGLLVGVAAVGIVSARDVLERRQELGMLRAVGFTRRHVQRLVLTEAVVTTTLGAALGTILGLLMARGLHATLLQDLGVAFTVPWLDVALVLLLTGVATLLAAAVPAWNASKVPPAEAVRTVD